MGDSFPEHQSIHAMYLSLYDGFYFCALFRKKITLCLCQQLLGCTCRCACLTDAAVAQQTLPALSDANCFACSCFLLPTRGILRTPRVRFGVLHSELPERFWRTNIWLQHLRRRRAFSKHWYVSRRTRPKKCLSRITEAKAPTPERSLLTKPIVFKL